MPSWTATPLFPTTSEAGLATVQLHALSAGHFTLPEEQFVQPASPGARKTVPSLSFLVQHRDPTSGNVTRIVFDLGLRGVIERYSEPIQRHVATRQPLTTNPDVVKSLKEGGLTPDDIDFVFYSHVSPLELGSIETCHGVAPHDRRTATRIITVADLQARSIGIMLVSRGIFLAVHSLSAMELWTSFRASLQLYEAVIRSSSQTSWISRGL
jgi:hypothetical protein